MSVYTSLHIDGLAEGCSVCKKQFHNIEEIKMILLLKGRSKVILCKECADDIMTEARIGLKLKQMNKSQYAIYAALIEYNDQLGEKE